MTEPLPDLTLSFDPAAAYREVSIRAWRLLSALAEDGLPTREADELRAVLMLLEGPA